jgi:hypothetical protein
VLAQLVAAPVLQGGIHEAADVHEAADEQGIVGVLIEQGFDAFFSGSG